MARYVFEYKHTSIHLGPRDNDVYTNKRSFNTLKEVRTFAYVRPGRFGQVMSTYEGYVFDTNTGKVVAAIDSDRYIYKQNGKLYCRFMYGNGTFDSHYGKMNYSGKYKF